MALAALALLPLQAALLLAVLQGVAEFLPISSSGHLVIAQALLGWSEFGMTFDVALHLGTLVAVVWAYRRDLLALARDIWRGEWRLALWLLLASVPAGVIGVGFEEHIEAAFHSPRVAGMGLCVTALALYFGERVRTSSRIDERASDSRPLRWRDALVVGCAQAVAILPGISRSGSTIAAGLVCGLPAVHATRLSFLMSIIAVGGACALKVPDLMRDGAGEIGAAGLALAVTVSGLVGWASLRFLLLIVAKGAFRWFAAYCALVGLSVLIFL